MISGRESMKIWDDVDVVGVDPDLFNDATAVEEPADRINEQKFLEKCATDDKFAKYAHGSIEVSPVVCSY
jgi:hypothetical protein